jgi:BirA family biotin operon repressor/biotin-[acetyl-CoA-carboxylase] ligase
MDVDALNSDLTGTIFAGRVQHFATIGSTNTLAVSLAQKGEPEGTVLLADEQTAGRGRGDYSWHSEPGNGIYCSILLRPKMAAADLLWLSLMTGLAVHGAVREITTLQADLRWPNDLMLSGKKFCGILTDVQIEGQFVRHAVVGIGMNVNHEAFPGHIAPIATSLREETGRGWDRQEIVASLLKQFAREYRALQANAANGNAGFDILRRLTAASSWIRGKRVRVAEDGGYDGVTAGLDAHGFLLVNTGDEVRKVISGGVRAL